MVNDANFHRSEFDQLQYAGDGFLLGVAPPALKFWAYIQENLELRGKNVGFAILNYTLVPDRSFPTQVVLAIQHLIKLGVKPGNIQIADSAGGTLIHETLSHLLRPVVGVPELSLSAPLVEVYMMSPWTRLVDNDGKSRLYSNDCRGDVLTGKALNYRGSEVLRNASKEAIRYLEPNSASSTWLSGVDRYVKRVLVSAGGVEMRSRSITKM